jgi:hypothetical protein
MAFREVAVTEIREVLRAWLSGAGLRRANGRRSMGRAGATESIRAAMLARPWPAADVRASRYGVYRDCTTSE